MCALVTGVQTCALPICGTVSGWFPDDDRIKPPPWVPALQESLSGSLREQEPLFAKAYLQLGEDSAGTDVYQLAAAFYQAKGRPADGPSADYAQLLQALAKPEQALAHRVRGQGLAARADGNGPGGAP